MVDRSSSVRRTSIEEIRRRDLVEAAFRTFLDRGIAGTTVARIGERAGMSHGIVNYYFKSKGELLSAVIRHAFQLIQRQCLLHLREAKTPRERISAVIAGNFPEELFTPDIAAAWISFYAEVPTNPDFERLQDAFYRRLRSNLVYHLKQLVSSSDAERIALGISVWIDGLWLRSAMQQHGIDRKAAIRAVEDYVDTSLAQAAKLVEQQSEPGVPPRRQVSSASQPSPPRLSRPRTRLTGGK
jgi:TetR/AcrR family transcriptional regulator, transcriptional repressor of bet genes